MWQDKKKERSFKNTKGQCTVEYLLLFAVIILFFFFFLQPGSKLEKSLNTAIETNTNSMEGMANRIFQF